MPPVAAGARTALTLIVLALGFLLLSAAGARAQVCSTTITNTNFGTANLAPGTAVDTTATLSVSCTGMTNGMAIKACPSFNAGTGGVSGTSRTMTNGANTLLYNLYSDAARSVRWGSATDASLGSVPVVTVTRSGSTGTGAATVYGRIAANQRSTQPGSYSSSFAGHVSVKYVNGTTCTATTTGTTTPSFSVLATVPASCTLTAAALSFGTRGVVDALVDAASSLSVTCANTLAYSVQLDNGQTGTAPTARKMTQLTESLLYGLYRDAARTLAWGGSGSSASGTGTGLAQALTVYGRVPAQSTPSPGLYSDIVVATVVY